MSRLCSLTLLLLVLLLVPANLLFAQSITLSPTSPTAAFGKTLQFTVKVSGLSNAAVTWSVESVVGGNTTYGTISTTGLYTAPTVMPGQNPVQITATSTVNSKISGSENLIILTTGPAITSVTPNPLPLGTFKVTIKGRRFLAGAVVSEKSDNSAYKALPTVYVKFFNSHCHR